MSQTGPVLLRRPIVSLFSDLLSLLWESLSAKLIHTFTAPLVKFEVRPLRGTGGHGFKSRSGYTKSLEMALAAPLLALRLTG